MAEPLSIFGSEVTAQGSVGIALGSGEQTTSEIMRSADLAMYRAKGEGKGRYALYEPSMHEGVLERLALKADLQRAVVAEEFDVHYQPIVALQSGAVSAWKRCCGGDIPSAASCCRASSSTSPRRRGSSFRSDGSFSTGRASRSRAGDSVGHADLGVSVNISAKQLSSRLLASEVTAALE